MSAVIDNTRFTTTSNIARLMPTVLSADVESKTSFSISSNVNAYVKLNFPDFHFECSLQIVNVSILREQSICEVKMLLIDGVYLILELVGEINKRKDKVIVSKIEQIIIRYELIKNQALQQFVNLTFEAILSLANKISLETLETTVSLSIPFNTHLKEITNVLQKRQIAYRVMVIEKALGLEIELPSNISGEEVAMIAYLYNSIVNKFFVWSCKFLTHTVYANQESLSWLQPDRKLPPVRFPSSEVKEELFGHKINLGRRFILIKESIIENYDDVKRELSHLDGRLVDIIIRPLDGRVEVFTLDDTPRLPENAWEEQIQTFIDLSPQLSKLLANRYHALAAATLDGLTEEMKIAVTTRPEITPFSLED